MKPLYGHQEGAVVSYNPNKRGRPSHSYHCYMVANLRLVLAAVKRAVERAMGEQDWQNAGARWQGKDGRLRLEGWSRYRRIVVLRRRIERELTLSERDDDGQLRLGFAEIDEGREVFEYAVLVTSLDDEILSLGQLYRDRADCEIGQS